MATLTGQRVSDSYGNLTQISGGVTSSLKTLQDGLGNNTSLSISTIAAKIIGTLEAINSLAASVCVIIKAAVSQSANLLEFQNSAGTVLASVNSSGGATFPTISSSNGSGIGQLNASNLTTGTIPGARFPATLPTASGINLTNLNASNIASGTIDNARLSGDVVLSSFGSISAVSFSGDGTGLFNLDYNNVVNKSLMSGTYSDCNGMLVASGSSIQSDSSITTDGMGTLSASGIMCSGQVDAATVNCSSIQCTTIYSDLGTIISDGAGNLSVDNLNSVGEVACNNINSDGGQLYTDGFGNLITTGTLQGNAVQGSNGTFGSGGLTVEDGGTLTALADVTFSGLPTSDPSIPGRLWCDTMNGNVIKVS